ncbi:MAG: hypothetical protein DDG60_05730 [Anaerolineae bacterium]|nr:MAG: hypothetical protein DDG60_05730 [Anaerolineae bacterium]
MTTRHPLAGVYAAALTPLKPDFSIDPDAIVPFLNFLAARDCHGALLFGTTGEGPSFSTEERKQMFQVAQGVRQTFPEFRLLAGTGTPSLTETITLTRLAFEAGCEGVVVLPPYYYRKANDDGLFLWYDQVIRQAVPQGGYLLGYHIPHQAGMGLSLDLLARLKDAHPQKFAGIKDSSGDADYAIALGGRFGPDLLVLTGNDRLLLHALEHHAGGAITAIANLYSPLLRQVWNIFSQGEDAIEAQEELTRCRSVFDHYTPFPSILKAMLARIYGFARWPVRPPLLPVPQQTEEQCCTELHACQETV